jgi:hypothetical protein
MAIAAALTGQVQRATAALWIAGLRSPEVVDAFDSIGLRPDQRYFPPRVAPMGPVPATVVVSTFYNFSPDAVASAVPSAWEVATPQQILDAQLTGVDRTFRRAFADIEADVISEAAALARSAAEEACEHPEGRPLFAGYASLPWPDEPHLVLWHAHYLLREFRGDGHIAALVAEGITGVEAHVIHIAMVPALFPMYRPSRRWNDFAFDAAVDRLRSRGRIADGDDLTMTPEGFKWREAIEDRTDELAVPAYDAIGTEGCERLAALGEEITRVLQDGGLAFPMPSVADVR